jgi:hypothetical protein
VKGYIHQSPSLAGAVMGVELFVLGAPVACPKTQMVVVLQLGQQLKGSELQWYLLMLHLRPLLSALATAG